MMKLKVAVLVFSLFSANFSGASSAAASSSAPESHKNFLIGSTGELRCSSSFPPPWSKIGSSAGDYRIIGLNGKKHPNWQEPRFEFFSQANNNNFVIRISDVQLTDAGKYICEGDSSTAYLVSVMR